jgi:hypothetical protein
MLMAGLGPFFIFGRHCCSLTSIKRADAALEQSAFHIFDTQEMLVQPSLGLFASASASNIESA